MNKQRVLQALENVKSNPYGKWGILNIEQRRFIKELCNSWLILDDATNKQQEEIERQKEVINGMIDNEEKYNLEIIKLKSIIKEVREYIEEKKYSFCDDYDLRCEDGKKILEILDKENK